MEQDSNFLISKKFNDKYDAFFKIEQHKNIENSFYALGVLLRSNHLKYKNTRPYNPKDVELIEKWDIETWTKVTWGADDIKADNVYEKEFEDALLSGVPYFEYLVSQAVKHKRPTWCMFGLIGMMQGTLNQNQYEVSTKEDLFTKEDFVRCLKYFSKCFLKQHQTDLQYLFHYFDERGYFLRVEMDSENIVIE